MSQAKTGVYRKSYSTQLPAPLTPVMPPGSPREAPRWRKEWARDDDGDGVREVHSNTIEGFWLGLRNYLRPFRGVSKWRLDLYLAFYQGMHNFRHDVLGFLGRLLGPVTSKGS